MSEQVCFTLSTSLGGRGRDRQRRRNSDIHAHTQETPPSFHAYLSRCMHTSICLLAVSWKLLSPYPSCHSEYDDFETVHEIFRNICLNRCTYTEGVCERMYASVVICVYFPYMCAYILLHVHATLQKTCTCWHIN